LFDVDLYLDCFNRAYTKQRKNVSIKAADLPPGERIIERIERHLSAKAIEVRPSGDFNHYLVAFQFASAPPRLLDKCDSAKV
jgi:hypothetical protein